MGTPARRPSILLTLESCDALGRGAATPFEGGIEIRDASRVADNSRRKRLRRELVAQRAGPGLATIDRRQDYGVGAGQVYGQIYHAQLPPKFEALGAGVGLLAGAGPLGSL